MKLESLQEPVHISILSSTHIGDMKEITFNLEMGNTTYSIETLSYVVDDKAKSVAVCNFSVTQSRNYQFQYSINYNAPIGITVGSVPESEFHFEYDTEEKRNQIGQCLIDYLNLSKDRASITIPIGALLGLI